MHTIAFTSEEKKQLRLLSLSDTNIGLAVAHLSKRSSRTKEDKVRRVWAKDICTAALKKSLKEL